MSMHVTVALDDDGPIAVKTATGDADRARLRLEAERLGHARHPGLVAVVAPEPAATGGRDGHPGDPGDRGDPGARDDADVELRTRFAGDPVSRWTGTVASVAGLGAAVAATLADLHDIDVVHGRIDSSHVLVGEDGRPRLCGLSHPGGAAREDDVAALGQVLSDLLARVPAERRGLFSWPRSQSGERRRLERVIAWALDPVPSRRPSARLLSRSILDAVPDAELPEPVMAAPIEAPLPPPAPPGDELLDLVLTHELSEAERWAQAFGDETVRDETAEDELWARAFRDETVDDHPLDDRPVPHRPARSRPAAAVPEPGPARRSARTRVVAGSGVVAAAIAAGVMVVSGWGQPGSKARQDADADIVPAARSGCPSVEPPAADVDGDGCPERLVVHGHTITAGADGWTLGQPGDVVAVGDWECDGRAAPALLRPATGDVFVFPGWAAEDQPVTVAARDRVPAAVAIRAVAGDAGCDDLVVELDSGATTAVEVRP